jgi:DNA integrity scanning protein DisA with diadenylate cyclase activity
VLQKLNFAISCALQDIYEILGAVLSFLRDSQLSNRDETNTIHNQKSSLSEKSYLKKIDRSVFELTGNKQTNRLTQNDISRQMYRLRAAKIKFCDFLCFERYL